LEFFAEYLNFY